MTRFDLIEQIQKLYALDDDVRCTAGAGRVGGHLHIVLDDFNFCDSHVKFCINEAEVAADGRCRVCIDLGRALLTFTEDERADLISEAHEAKWR